MSAQQNVLHGWVSDYVGAPRRLYAVLQPEIITYYDVTGGFLSRPFADSKDAGEEPASVGWASAPHVSTAFDAHRLARKAVEAVQR